MFSGILTTLGLLAFLAVVIWVFVVKRKEDFDEQASLPLDDEQRGARENRNREENQT